MVNKYSGIDKDTIEDRLKEFGEEPELFLVAGHEDDMIYVPGVHQEAFEQCFPEAKLEGKLEDVPIFWTPMTWINQGSDYLVQHISASVLAMHAKGAVCIGQNCEGMLFQQHGVGLFRKLAGFYQEMSNKDYLFAYIGNESIDSEYDTPELVLAIYGHDANLVSFLEGLGIDLPEEEEE